MANAREARRVSRASHRAVVGRMFPHERPAARRSVAASPLTHSVMPRSSRIPRALLACAVVPALVAAPLAAQTPSRPAVRLDAEDSVVAQLVSRLDLEHYKATV